MVKGTGCFCRIPGFDSLYPHYESQQSITPVLGDEIPLEISMGAKHICGADT